MLPLHVSNRDLHERHEEVNKMRDWSAVGAVAVLLGVGAVGGSVAGVEPDKATPAASDAVAERGSPAGLTKVASVKYAEPDLGTEDLGIEAIVFVETGTPLRAVRCASFVLERDAPRTTITAFCKARKAALGQDVQLRVDAYRPNANSYSACGTEGELQRKTRLSCRVSDPHMVPTPPEQTP